ncbi:MAG: ATP-binding cassette domain-containing protein [Bacilli bacterium]
MKANIKDHLVMYDHSISLNEVHDIMLKYNLYDLLKIDIKVKEDLLLTVESLSIGQKQLLALYRALFTKKSFLIFDEATCDIDASTALVFFNLLTSFNQDSIYIIVSHQLEKLEMCSKLYQMKKGLLYE